MKEATRKITALGRFLIGALIIWYLLSRMNLGEISLVLKNTLNHWPWLLLSFWLFFACLLLGAIRWKIALNVQKINLSWPRTFVIYLIGHFFNAFMFGTTGGDIARIFYTVRETHGRKTETAITVIMDRITGMSALMAITAAMLILKHAFYLSHVEFRALYFIMWAVIVLVVCALIFVLNMKKLKKLSIVQRIMENERWKIGHYLKRVYRGFGIYKNHTGILALMVLISAMAHIIVFIQCNTIGIALEINLGLIDYLTVVPMIIFVSSIPITPGGVGVREYMAVAMLGTLNVPQSQAFPLSIMIYFNLILWSLMSGIVFICYSTGSGHSIMTDMDDIRHEALGENENIPG